MEKLYITFRFNLISKIRLGSDDLEKITFKKDRLSIEISPPLQLKTAEETQQFITVCIINDFEVIPELFDKIYHDYLEIAENYFLRTYNLIRFHTRQHGLGNPKSNNMKQNLFSVKNDKGVQLYNMNNVIAYMTPIDNNEYDLNKNIWIKVIEYLINDKEPEIYYLLLLDAKYHAFSGRTREAIIMLAVGIEQFTVEYLKRDKYEEAKEIEFCEFFNNAVSEFKGKSLKESRKDDYHRLKYLFQIRNKISHGQGCFFKIGKDEKNLVERLFGQFKIEDDGKVEINKYNVRHLVDHMIALVDWIQMN